MQSTGTAGVRDRDHHVDVVIRPHTHKFVGQVFAHAEACLVHRNAVDHRIGTRKINILENARIQFRLLCALLVVEVALEIDEYRFTRRNVAQELEAQRIQRHAFGRDQVFHALVGLVAAHHQRTDAVHVAECQQAVARNHRHHGIRAATTAMHGGDSGKDGLGIETEVGGVGLQFMRQHVEQHFRIGVGIHMAHVLEEQFFLQLRGVGEIAVMAQHQPEWRVHVERLRLIVIDGGAGGRIAHMRDASVAGQRAHVARAEHVVREAVTLVQMERTAIQRGNARRILPAMLQHLQPVIQQLIDGALRNDT